MEYNREEMIKRNTKQKCFAIVFRVVFCNHKELSSLKQRFVRSIDLDAQIECFLMIITSNNIDNDDSETNNTNDFKVKRIN